MKRWFWLILMAMTILTGCGQKGPLYLPDQAPPAAAQQQLPAQ